VTQAAVLLPVLALAGLTAWTMLTAPTNARGQTASDPAAGQTVGLASRPDTQPQSTNAGVGATALLAAPAGPERAAPVEPPPVNGLKISSQAWRRGGLGSNALITFTLRNDNPYAVKDIEIACAFSRQDGSHLTDRKRLIPDILVNMKSRKTFAQVHIGFVNIYANKAKCTAIAANRA
jgi:hypothetical protein